jgi:multimeric flavodoxin WrbA
VYKTMPWGTWALPAPDVPLRVLVLNCSLKHGKDLSNTGEQSELVLTNMKEMHKSLVTEVVRVSDLNLPVGLGFKESDDDDWPGVVTKIKAADIVLFATPIWWGGRSSLMQRVIERLDALDEEYIASGRSALYNKVAGIVITGSEDGALSTLGTIMMVLTFMGFTLPPECAAYWVGEVGQPVAQDREKRLANDASKHMAKNLARNTLYYAQLLKEKPLLPEPAAAHA